ncbi:MAG: MobH family relaxase [Burkholderiales bacterium]
MQNFLRKIVGRGSQHAPSLAAPVPPTLSNPRPYPPNDGLLEVMSVDAVITHSGKEIDLLAQAVGMSVDKTPQLLIDPIRRLCEMTLMLPATRDEFYRGPGGLFRMSIDTALFAARVAHQTEFSGLGAIEKRRIEGPRWRLACTLAGLTVDLHRIMTAFQVTSLTGDEWSPLKNTLAEFVSAQSAVQLVWHPEDGSRRCRAHNLSLLPSVLGPHVIHELHRGGREIVEQMYAYISDDANSNAASNHVRAVVDPVRLKLIAKDLATDPMRFGRKQTGIALGPYMADAMRSLIRDGKWTVNDQKGRIWRSHDGVFIIWPVAAKELTAWLTQMSIKGVPRDEHTIVQLMKEAGIITPCDPTVDDIAGALWPITLPNGREVNALKLASHSVLWPIDEGPEPTEIAVRLGRSEPPFQQVKPRSADSDATTNNVQVPSPAVSLDKQHVKTAPDPTKKKSSTYPSAELVSAIGKLPKPLQVVINDLVRQFRLPSQAQRIAHTRPDGRVELFADFIAAYGIERDVLADLFRQAGWVDAHGKLFTSSQKTSSTAVMLLNAEYSALVLPGDIGALFSSESATTSLATS